MQVAWSVGYELRGFKFVEPNVNIIRCCKFLGSHATFCRTSEPQLWLLASTTNDSCVRILQRRSLDPSRGSASAASRVSVEMLISAPAKPHHYSTLVTYVAIMTAPTMQTNCKCSTRSRHRGSVSESLPQPLSRIHARGLPSGDHMRLAHLANGSAINNNLP